MKVLDFHKKIERKKMKTWLSATRTRATLGNATSNTIPVDGKRPARLSVRLFLSAGIAFGIFAPIAWYNATASAADDQEIVAGLDTRYQAAVQKNNAVTMDHILADDFVLVTSSGKTYSKADLLR